MVSATLAFGRDARANEPVSSVDLVELLRTILDETSDANPESADRLTYCGPPHQTVRVRPVLAFVGAAAIDTHDGHPDVLVVAGTRLDTELREYRGELSLPERDRIVAALFEWLRIPSISSHPDAAADVVRSAEYCAGLLSAAAFSLEPLARARFPRNAPRAQVPLAWPPPEQSAEIPPGNGPE